MGRTRPVHHPGARRSATLGRRLHGQRDGTDVAGGRIERDSHGDGLDDGVFEGDETVLVSGQRAGESFDGEVTLTIADDGGASAVTASAVAPAVAGDFILEGSTLSFAADATQRTGEVTITAVDNDVDAPDKTVTVSGTVSLAGAEARAAATLTITDDEPPPVQRGVTVSPTELSVVEGDENGGTYRVNLIADPSADVTITVSVPPDNDVAVVPVQFTIAAADW